MKRSPAARAAMVAMVAVVAFVAAATIFGVVTTATGAPARAGAHAARSFADRTPPANPAAFRICAAVPGGDETC